MYGWMKILNRFIEQAHKRDPNTSKYPKEWDGVKMEVCFGTDTNECISWIVFTDSKKLSIKSRCPIYLYNKDSKKLVLAGVPSDSEEFKTNLPTEIINYTKTQEGFFSRSSPKVGNSFVFKTYKIELEEKKLRYFYLEYNSPASSKCIESELQAILNNYKKRESEKFFFEQGENDGNSFCTEKHLEDHIINNWDRTNFGKKYDLIVKEGKMISQQYRTDLGPIDILVKDKNEKNHVVIELKNGKGSDQTIGQLARYMGWIQEKKGDKNEPKKIH